MLEGFFLPGTERKFGITTPRYSGKSYQRNRVKRIMRETYRLNPDKFPQDGTLLFHLKKHEPEERILSEMLQLTDKVTGIAASRAADEA